ncbi:glycosyltransferase [Microvirga massiliensis]|uniref:glycosyltransferase n=1 Tax=Microvirga massiliensis TaxID=1033741 RepID=UPI00062BA459|nr:glycosyltransferase [Microvirga massiliensis]
MTSAFVIRIAAPLYRRLRPLARRSLSYAVKERLAPLAEAAFAGEIEHRFDRRAIALRMAEPAFVPELFARGPILLVNNALAWGGVERQVVNTLLGVADLTELSLGLLCLRLGESPDHDFYKPALAAFAGFVRNAMDPDAAEEALARTLDDAALLRIKAAIGWLPDAVRAEVLRFAAEFASLKPSVVHAWQDAASIAAGYAARLVGVPRIILSGRNVAPPNFATFRPYMVHAYRELAACPGVVLVNNSEAGAADYARWLGLPPDRFRVKRNGIDPPRSQRANPGSVVALRARLGIPEGVPVVGSIFRFCEEKQPFLWIEAAALVARCRPDAHFVIFGAGPLREKALALAARRGLGTRLHFPGTMSDAALGLSLLDVFLLTSRFEGTPNVVLEASILGVPVVATEAGGTREAIAPGSTGILVQEHDPRRIADAVLSILGDPAWAPRARKEGPRFVAERFGFARMLDETLRLYGLSGEPQAR